jgi:chorismate synthase
MSGNTLGKMFKVTTFGSSHGIALGAVVDGCPAGLELSDNDIQSELDKRRPGTSQITSSRNEKDEVKILS